MSLVLEHFCVSKFRQGNGLRGKYAVIAKSPHVESDLIGRATDVDVMGKMPSTENSPNFRGYAFFALSSEHYAIVSYRRSSISTIGRSGYPSHKHYALVSRKQLSEIGYDVELVCKLLQEEMFADELKIVDPLVVDTTPVSASCCEELEDPQLLQGFSHILANRRVVFRHHPASPEARLRIVCAWMSLVPREFRRFLTFTTNTSTASADLTICFLEESAPRVPGELNFQDLPKPSRGAEGTAYISWVRTALQSSYSFHRKLDKLPLPYRDTELQLGRILDLCVHFERQWPPADQTSPDSIQERLLQFAPFLPDTEHSKWTIKIIGLFVYLKKYDTAIEILKTYADWFVDERCVEQLAKAMPIPVPDEMIRGGLKYVATQDLIVRVIRINFGIMLTRQQYRNSHDFFLTICSLPTLKSDFLFEIATILEPLSSEDYRSVLTNLLLRYGTEGLELIHEHLGPRLPSKFPYLSYLFLEMRRTSGSAPSVTQDDILLKIYETAGNSEIWLLRSIQLAARSHRWHLLTPGVLGLAVQEQHRTSHFSDDWAVVWKGIQQRIDTITGLDSAVWNQLCLWAIFQRDFGTALRILMELQSDWELADQNLSSPHDVETLFKEKCNPETAVQRLLEAKPNTDAVSENWRWIWLASRFLRLYRFNSKLAPVYSHIIARMNCIQYSSSFFDEINAGRIRPEACTQSIIFLLKFLSKTDSRISDLEHVFFRRAFSYVLEIALVFDSECSYLLELKRTVEKVGELSDLYWLFFEEAAKSFVQLQGEESWFQKLQRLRWQRESVWEPRIFRREAFIMENAFITQTWPDPSKLHAQVLNLLLQDIDFMLTNQLTFYRPAGQWLQAIIPQSNGYFELLIKQLEDQDIVRDLRRLSKKLQFRLSAIKLKKPKRLLRVVDVLLLDFVAQLHQYLEASCF